MQPGREPRRSQVTFPEDYGAEDLAGKEAAFEITAKVKLRRPSPPIDDALAKKLGFESLDELRERDHRSRCSANTTSSRGCG